MVLWKHLKVNYKLIDTGFNTNQLFCDFVALLFRLFNFDFEEFHQSCLFAFTPHQLYGEACEAFLSRGPFTLLSDVV